MKSVRIVLAAGVVSRRALLFHPFTHPDRNSGNMMNQNSLTTPVGRKIYITPASVFSLFAFSLLLMALLTFPRVSRAAGSPSGITGGDTDHGKQFFEKRCTGCHSLDQDKEGPRLRGVYGRKAGSVPSFKYSSALKSSHVTWDDSSLDKWLTDPDSLVPDNDMSFHVPKADERADIIRFLKATSGK